MKIKFKPHGFPNSSTCSLSEAVTYDIDGYSGQLETIRGMLNKTLDFIEHVTSSLHNKGVLTDEDIASLISDLSCIQDFKIIKEDVL